MLTLLESSLAVPQRNLQSGHKDTTVQGKTQSKVGSPHLVQASGKGRKVLGWSESPPKSGVIHADSQAANTHWLNPWNVGYLSNGYYLPIRIIPCHPSDFQSEFVEASFLVFWETLTTLALAGVNLIIATVTAEKWEELSTLCQLGKKNPLLMIQVIFSSLYTFLLTVYYFLWEQEWLGLKQSHFIDFLGWITWHQAPRRGPSYLDALCTGSRKD